MRGKITNVCLFYLQEQPEGHQLIKMPGVNKPLDLDEWDQVKITTFFTTKILGNDKAVISQPNYIFLSIDPKLSYLSSKCTDCSLAFGKAIQLCTFFLKQFACASYETCDKQVSFWYFRMYLYAEQIFSQSSTSLQTHTQLKSQ